MKFLRDIPLKRKLAVISLMTSGVALLFTCGAIMTFELVDSRRAMRREVRTTANMIGDNCAAALAFGDKKAARLTLESLGSDEHVVAAFIYDSAGKVFASYQPPGAAPLAPPLVRGELHLVSDHGLELLKNPFADGYMDAFREIRAAGESVGTVYLRHDMGELQENFRRLGLMVLGVMAAASLIALVLSRRLLSVVSGPIVALEQVVRDVASRRDFSLRAVPHGSDEVGRLIGGCNEMLGEIERRDRELEAGRDELEARVTERTVELASSLEVHHATLNSTADGVLALTPRGEVICFNSKYADMWGMPPAVIARRNRREMLAFTASRVCDPASFLARVPEGDHPWKDGDFDVIDLKDGRTFERYVHTAAKGQGIGAVINFRDVTERKRADERLAEASMQLLETSRRAGMAEVATSVLHNVGNVLNSVNVSCSVVADRVSRSRVGSVARTAALLEEHAADLPAFLTTHPSGKNLAGYLGKLAAKLAADRAEALHELKLLGKNLDHIKEIVAMQQSYAKVSGVAEDVDVAELVEDSLRMNEGTLRQRAVEVCREIGALPPVRVERHKALQILVNLIRNASHACQDSANPDKRLTIRATGGADHVAISVIDNGVGIPAENLTRIFAHGFTTKRDGHGFGLHNGALAAREMGGALLVHSEGPDTGSTFTLQLPPGVPAGGAPADPAPAHP